MLLLLDSHAGSLHASDGFHFPTLLKFMYFFLGSSYSFNVRSMENVSVIYTQNIFSHLNCERNFAHVPYRQRNNSYFVYINYSATSSYIHTSVIYTILSSLVYIFTVGILLRLNRYYYSCAACVAFIKYHNPSRIRKKLLCFFTVLSFTYKRIIYAFNTINRVSIIAATFNSSLSFRILTASVLHFLIPVLRYQLISISLQFRD